MGIDLVRFFQSKSKKAKVFISIMASLTIPLAITFFKFDSIFKTDSIDTHTIISVNQKGGTNFAGDLIINKTPKPKVKFVIISANEKLSENEYKTVIQLTIDAFYPVAAFSFEIKSPTLNKAEIIPNDSTSVSARLAYKKGYCLVKMRSAQGIYIVTLLSDKAEKFNIAYDHKLFD